jgi:hypothetical protein
MFKKLILIVSALFTILITEAQTDTSHLRVSLLTCGPGEEIWETFGHTAIRVIDSVEGTDIVYNYGTFSFGEGFEMKFMRGKLLYYVSYYPYKEFLEEYVEAKRNVDEQVLLLDGDKKQDIYAFLKNNALEENRYYKYDFFFDNCATRIRDVFPRSLDGKFKFGATLASRERLSYRNIMNQYFYRVHWERVGCNLLLGSPIDRIMSNEDIMFLPDFLKDGIGGATVDGKQIASAPFTVLPGSEKKPAGINEPFILTMIILLLTLVGLTYRPLKIIGSVMTFILLLVTGLLGCLMLFMWLGTDHQACQNNFNLLWALPTNVILAFSKKSNKSRYAVVGIILLLLALVFHVLRIQELPLMELLPVLLALLFIYGSIYKKRQVA